MEKNSSIVLSESEKAEVRGGEVPSRFIGWYTLQELQEFV